MRYFIVVLGTVIVAAGCGDDDGPGSGTYAAKCAAPCALPTDGPCAEQDTSACTAQCVALTEGLSVSCVQCIVEHSAWTGKACTCYGTPCTLCSFGVGDHSCHGAAPNDECTAAQESCSGFELATASSGACATVCAGGIVPDGGAQ